MYGFVGSGFLSRLPLPFWNVFRVAPHAFDWVLWTGFFLLVLIPRFGLRAWFAMALTWGGSELVFNSLYLGACPGAWIVQGTGSWILWASSLSGACLISLIILRKQILVGDLRAFYPFGLFVGSWLGLGMPLISGWCPGSVFTLSNWPWEVGWNLLYLFGVFNVLRARNRSTETSRESQP